MKYFKVLLFLITCIGYSQNTEINNVFFKIPLNNSRDSIYQYCNDSGLFIKKSTKHKVTKNGKEPKLFSGSLKNLSPELIKKKIDSVHIQLSFGSVSFDDKSQYKDLLIFWSYYYSTDAKSMKQLFADFKNQISLICKEKPYHSQNFEQKENGKKILVGYSEKWFFKNDINLEIELNYEKLEEKKYLVKLEYSRFEQGL